VGLVQTGCGEIRAVGVIGLGVKKFGYEMDCIIRRVETQVWLMKWGNYRVDREKRTLTDEF